MINCNKYKLFFLLFSLSAIRVDAVAIKARERHNHSFVEVSADSRTAVVENLLEKTEYLLSVTAVTEEYFEQLPPGHDQKRDRQLPVIAAPPEDPWLPSSSVLASTSGTDAPYDLKVNRMRDLGGKYL